MLQYIRQLLVDPRTGELLDSDAQLAINFPKRINGFGGLWVAVGQDTLFEILTHYDFLKGEGLRVLLSAMAVLRFDNDLVVNQSELARKIGMKASNFNRGWRKLIQLGIIIEVPQAGCTKSYKLNPSFGWKGSSKRHKEILRRGKF